MAAKKPPPRTLEPEDERKVHLFLERAAPIVLDNRVLTNESWAQLVTLANELELSHEQLRATIADLQKRGVIERIDLSPPKPPPLPKAARSATAGSGEPQSDDGNSDSRTSEGPQADAPQAARETAKPPKSGAAQSPNGEGSAGGGKGGDESRPARDGPAQDGPARTAQLRTARIGLENHPAHHLCLQRRDAPAWENGLVAPNDPVRLDDGRPSSDRPAKPAEGITWVEPSEPTEDSAADSGSVPQPPPEPAAAALRRDSEEADRLRRFSRRAVAILAEQRGMNAQRHKLMLAAAGDLGLNDDEAERAIKALQGSAVTGTGTAAGTGTASKETGSQRRRWRVEGEPDPPPPAPSRKPEEIYREFVVQSLQKLAVGHVSRDLEEGLVNHGVRVLKLSRAFARHLVGECAAQQDLLLESEVEARPETDQPTVDPRRKAFADRAAQILAQHRGINAKSRVLLHDAAREVGLGDEEMEAAISSLESGATPRGGLDDVQRERLEPFRKFLHDAFERLPRGILTASFTSLLVEQAEERYGLSPDVARTAIRELSAEKEVQVITEEEATRHVEGLVQETLGSDYRLDHGIRDRIIREGTNWGLRVEQAEKIVSEACGANYRRHRSEQKLSAMALSGALIAVLVVVAFLGWAIFGGRFAPRPPSVEPERRIAEAADPPAPRPDRDDSWWDVDLVVAVRNARIEFPQSRKTFDEIASTHPERRAAAYGKLVEQMLEQTDDELHRHILAQVLARSYASDPDDEVAGGIAQSLVARVPGPEDRLSNDVENYPVIFWSMRAAVAALAASDTPERSQRMARQIGQVVGTSVAADQPLRQLERQCLGALAERLFRLMIATATANPEEVAELHDVIASEASRYLDDANLDLLNADFLVAVLAAAEENWRDYRDVIARTVAARDPLTIVKLIDLYEAASSDEFRQFLGPLLLDRAGIDPRAEVTVEEVGSVVRQALGVSDAPTVEGRWLKLLRLANAELSAADEVTAERLKLLQQSVRLARVATLATALSQGELGFSEFDTLLEKGAGPPAMEGGRGEVGPAAGRPDADWNAVVLVNRSIQQLQSASGPARRADRIESLARLAVRAPDIQPDQAEILAGYLLNGKSDAEHQAVLENLEALGHWPRLQLALADGLERTSLSRPHLQSFLETLLGREVEIGAGDAGRRAVQALILRNVLGFIAGRANPVDNPVEFDRSRQQLFNQYVAQARILKVPATAYQDAESPAEVLRAMIGHFAGTLTADDTDEAAAQMLRNLPHRLVAIDYAATDDLQQAVLLQREWLKLLSTALRKKRRDASDDLDVLATELEQSDRKAASAFAQLRDGEAAVLRTWILWNEPSG